MLKVGHGVTVTDGNGVRDDRDNEFDSFLCYGDVFKMNAFMRTRKMETILDYKGGTML